MGSNVSLLLGEPEKELSKGVAPRGSFVHYTLLALPPHIGPGFNLPRGISCHLC
jgi:hypothetical protein